MIFYLFTDSLENRKNAFVFHKFSEILNYCFGCFNCFDRAMHIIKIVTNFTRKFNCRAIKVQQKTCCCRGLYHLRQNHTVFETPVQWKKFAQHIDTEKKNAICPRVAVCLIIPDHSESGPDQNLIK